jgi:hypothetical protein
VIVTRAEEIKTHILVLSLQDAPTVDSMPATELHITYQQRDDEPPTSDLIVRFGKVNGHYPQRRYWSITEATRPRPDWTHPIITEHAPAWWRTAQDATTT